MREKKKQKKQKTSNLTGSFIGIFWYIGSKGSIHMNYELKSFRPHCLKFQVTVGLTLLLFAGLQISFESCDSEI